MGPPRLGSCGKRTPPCPPRQAGWRVKDPPSGGGELRGQVARGAAQVEDLQAASTELVATPAEHHRVKTVREDPRNEDLSLTPVQEPADQVFDHLGPEARQARTQNESELVKKPLAPGRPHR